MTLTLGTGPFGPDTTGTFNFTRSGPAHVLYWEDRPRRVRFDVGGQTLCDTLGAKLLHETGILPVTYVPLADVRTDLLVPSGTTSHCPFKGDARYHSVRAPGGATVDDVLWEYPAPLEGAPPLAGYAAAFLDRLDAVYEEDERVEGHPRDPFHRVDALHSSRHVRVTVEGAVIAETDRAVLLYETGLPVRAYVPRADVRMDLLRPSDTRTHCPYKGDATYFAPVAGGDDVAWCYEDPLGEALPAAGHLAFLDDRATVEVADR